MEQQIIDIYQQILLRAPNQDEINYWLSVEADTSLAFVQQSIAASPEGVEIQTIVLPVIGLYQGLLGRAPEGEGFAFWVNAIATGDLTIQYLIDAFAGSDEFQEANPELGDDLSSEELATIFYQNLLGRAPDAVGLEFWTDLLESGELTPASFTSAFIMTPETQERIGDAIVNYVEDIRDGEIDNPDNEGDLGEDDGEEEPGGEEPGGEEPGTGGGGGNRGPVAVADTATALETDVTVSGSVATNDSDPNGDPLTYTLDAPVDGLTFNADGSFTFDATNAAYDDLADGETRDVVANYTVSDPAEADDQSTLTITVTGVNDAPVLNGDRSAEVAEGGSYTLTADDLGFTDVDDTEATFTVSALSAGTVVVGGSTVTSFTSTQLAASEVSFVHDGSETTAASFNVAVEDGNEDSSTPAAQAFSLTVTEVNDAPVLTGDGSAEVAEGGSYTLTADDLGFTDVDDTEATFTVSALSAGTVVVGGSTVTSFTSTQLAASEVSFVHDGSETTAASFNVAVEDGNEDSSVPVASAFNLTVTAVNDEPMGGVTITGTSTEGQTLTATNNLADADGLTGTISYQWQRGGVDITDATDSTYTLVQADVGAAITVVASYTDDQNTAESVTSTETDVVANVNDTPTGGVTITGTSTEGQTLTATNNLADADGLTGTISYQWQRGGVDITDATDSTYTLVQADVGAAITVVASYTDDQNTAESVTSTETDVVANVNDTPTGGVTITGTSTEGQTLTATNNLADADGLTGTISYQWQRGGVDITDATDSTYTLVQADVGAAITVVASYTDDQNTAESVTSDPTKIVGDVIDGTENNETLDGTEGADVINGLLGDDTLNGFGGEDKLFGSDGADILDGGASDSGNGMFNELTGGLGADTFHGNVGFAGTLDANPNDFIAWANGLSLIQDFSAADDLIDMGVNVASVVTDTAVDGSAFTSIEQVFDELAGFAGTSNFDEAGDAVYLEITGSGPFTGTYVAAVTGTDVPTEFPVSGAATGVSIEVIALAGSATLGVADFTFV